MSEKVEHLKMIEIIIERMGKNSFSMKGWATTLVTGVFALAAKESNPLFFLMAYLPIIAFWLLDSYYLQRERLFKSLYDSVRIMNESEINFSMDISPYKDASINKYRHCLISLSEAIYIPLALSPILVIIITNILM